MKSSIKVVACIFFVIVLVSYVSNKVTDTESAAPENELIGVWKAGELVETDLDIPETAKEVVPDWYMVFNILYQNLETARNPVVCYPSVTPEHF